MAECLLKSLKTTIDDQNKQIAKLTGALETTVEALLAKNAAAADARDANTRADVAERERDEARRAAAREAARAEVYATISTAPDDLSRLLVERDAECAVLRRELAAARAECSGLARRLIEAVRAECAAHQGNVEFGEVAADLDDAHAKLQAAHAEFATTVARVTAFKE
jgi:chromosome segregation ATPase